MQQHKLKTQHLIVVLADMLKDLPVCILQERSNISIHLESFVFGDLTNPSPIFAVLLTLFWSPATPEVVYSGPLSVCLPFVAKNKVNGR